MPFKSKAQQKKFGALVAEGKIKPETYNKWEKETKPGKLPERVTPKKRYVKNDGSK